MTLSGFQALAYNHAATWQCKSSCNTCSRLSGSFCQCCLLVDSGQVRSQWAFYNVHWRRLSFKNIHNEDTLLPRPIQTQQVHTSPWIHEFIVKACNSFVTSLICFMKLLRWWLSHLKGWNWISSSWKLNIQRDNSFGTIFGGQIQLNSCDLCPPGPMQRSLMQILMLVGLLVFFIQKMIRCVSLSWQGGRECLSHTRLAWELPPVDVCSCLLPCSGPGDWQHKRQFKGDWWGGYFTNRKFKGVDCVARTAESLGELDGTLHMTSMSQTSRLTWLNRYRFTAKAWSSSQPVDWLLVRLFDCWKVSAQLLNLYLQKSYDKGEAWVVCWPASAALVCFYLQFILWPIGPAVGDAPLPHWRSHVPFL